MIRAYRLIITNYEYAQPQLWEWQQPHIDNLSRSARTFGQHGKQRFFLNKEALNLGNYARMAHVLQAKTGAPPHRQLAGIAGSA